MNATTSLYDTIVAVCPIVGVSVGVWADKTTWRIDFDPSATAAQQAAALVVVQNFDPTAPINNPLYVSTTSVLSLLTLAEYKAIMQFAAADLVSVIGTGQLSMWLDLTRLDGQINLNDPVTQSVAQYLITNNLLTAARAAVIFAPPTT